MIPFKWILLCPYTWRYRCLIKARTSRSNMMLINTRVEQPPPPPGEIWTDIIKGSVIYCNCNYHPCSYIMFSLVIMSYFKGFPCKLKQVRHHIIQSSLRSRPINCRDIITFTAPWGPVSFSHLRVRDISRIYFSTWLKPHLWLGTRQGMFMTWHVFNSHMRWHQAAEFTIHTHKQAHTAAWFC